MAGKPEITDNQWKSISKHLTDNNLYVSDRECFQALIDSIWAGEAIRDRTKDNKHPSHSTLISRAKIWERKKKLPYMIKTLSRYLSDAQRDKLRKQLLKKTGWAGYFIDGMKPPTTKK